MFWLADAGLPIRETTSEEVVDPSRPNADTFAIAVYASHGAYKRTVREEGDVDHALRGYLALGGMLVSVSSGPVPFFRSKDGPVNSVHRLGLPVTQGWARPPEGSVLSFYVDTALPPGVDSPASCHGAGDLRWRPAPQDLVAPDDHYVPVARLRDEDGTRHGDGIANVEHVSSDPVGGKTLYVWMRMPDAIGADTFNPALFSFALDQVGQ